MGLRVIDKHEGKELHKIVNSKGELVHYQVGTPGDAATFSKAATLEAARLLLGKVLQKSA